MINTITKFLLFLALFSTGLFGSDASGGEFKGSLNLGGGYLAHPLGVGDEPDAGYLFQALRLSGGAGSNQHVFKASYEGQFSQFGNNTQLGTLRNSLGLEWFHNSTDRRKGLSAGLQGGFRNHAESYEIYDFWELYSYFSFKSFYGSRTLFKGFAALKIRQYDELPEESYLEPHAQLEIQRFYESRTALGLKVRYGWKQFNEDVASQVWGTLNLPSTSQLAARLNFSRGLSERTGFRAWGEYRWKLTEFPYFVAEDVYDSPILDRYATSGFDYFAALKTLGPAQIWFEAGGSFGYHDYGDIQFATADGGGQKRSDHLLEFYGALERTLGKSIGRPKLNLTGGWRQQNSTHPWYTYNGIFLSTNLYWKF